MAERQERLEHEIGLAKHVTNNLVDLSLSELADVSDFDKSVAGELKKDLLLVIEVLGGRIREQRLLVTKKKYAIRALMKKVKSNWKNSDVASAVSYIQTKIIQLQSCIEKMLRCIDHLMYIVACMNGTAGDYKRGLGVTVDLSHQSNYICMTGDVRESIDTSQPAITPVRIKQGSPKWGELREGAAVTGSTIYKAVGMETLKEQQVHHDFVFKGKPRPQPPPEVQRNMQHGIVNEINAVATLVAKVIPVYYPHLKYREDGCILIPMENSYMVVSGDGSGIDDAGENIIAFELKCPVPNKPYTPDVYYTFPVRYTTQVLSQMASKKCDLFCNLCYTSQSSTLFCGHFNSDLWDSVVKLLTDLYTTQSKRPTRKSPHTKPLKSELSVMANEIKFITELLSVIGRHCSCSQNHLERPGYHGHKARDTDQHVNVSKCDLWAQYTLEASELIQECYNLLRKPAKEILVTMMSDLDRITYPGDDHPHAVPIQYYMAGYSLKMTSVRQIIKEAVTECAKEGLNVKAVAFDGQFLEISVEDENHRPLTLCRLQKQVWQEIVKVPKSNQINVFAGMNYSGPICSYSDVTHRYNVQTTDTNGLIISSKESYPKLLVPRHFSDIVEQKTKTKSYEVNDESNNDFIFKFIPADLVEGLREKAIECIKQANEPIQQELDELQQAQNQQPEEDALIENPTHQTIHPVELHTDESDVLEFKLPDYGVLLDELKAKSSRPKCKSKSIADVQNYLQTAESINSNFTIPELKSIAALKPSVPVKGCKADLVNHVCSLYGDSSRLCRKRNVPTLRRQVLNVLNNMPKNAINVLTATNQFREKFVEWDKQNTFMGSAKIWTESGDTYTIPQWYAQPCFFGGQMVEPILDPRHILVNNRSKCCSNGIPGMGITREAWIHVATQGNTELTLQHVVELCDRQRNSYAQLTFSDEVEDSMRASGYLNEANWCSLMRNFYEAVDGSGCRTEERIRKLLDMWEFLCKQYNPFSFPPPGFHLKGLPMAQFEGLMTNIDRRMQMYSIVESRKYNQRAISSLDSETFFGSFQVFNFTIQYATLICSLYFYFIKTH